MKKIFMVLFILFLFAVSGTRVFALEDSFYEGEYISGEYIKKFPGDNNYGRYQQMRVFRRNSDDRVVYCIELWEALRNNVTLNGYDKKQYTYANMDYSTWEKVTLIAYYGYGYGDHTDIRWYAITQFMIWKLTSPESNLYFTDTLNGNKIIKYQGEMDEINELIKNHANMPSFNNATYQLTYNDSLTITDKNKVLDRFDITGSGGIDVVKNNYKLTVTKNSVGSSHVMFSNSGKIYDSVPVVYVDDGGQDVLLPGNYNSIFMVVNFNLLSSTVTVNKKDLDTDSNVGRGDGKLPGAKIQLLDIDDNVIQEKVVDEDGKLVFDNVAYGNYYLKEISAGDGYLVNDSILAIKVDDASENFSFYNEVIKNDVVITKYVVNPLTGVERVETGAIFAVYNSGGQEMLTFSTDNNGESNFELPYGKYTVKQISGIRNHYYTDDFIIEVTTDNKVHSFLLYSNQITSNIKIINTDSDSNLPILESGATFKIKNLETSEYVLDELGNVVILTTNDFGNTDVLTLVSGKYQVEQVGSIYGYKVNESVFEFEISDISTFGLVRADDCLDIAVSNTRLKSQFEIDKLTEYYWNDELIKVESDIDTSFTIYAKEDIYSKDGMKLYSKDQEVGIASFNDDKILTSYLDFGIYYFVNPIDNNIIEVVLDDLGVKKVEIVDRIFEYEDEFNDDVVKDDELDNESNLIIKVPDTFIEKEDIFGFCSWFILIGFYMVKKYGND